MTRRPNRLLAAAAGCGLLLLAAAGASAQSGNLGLVVRDGSIGPALPPGGNGVVQPGLDADGNFVQYLITPDLGEDDFGSNLFHSFQSFSVGDGEHAHFQANPQTSIILARVPGGQPSDILGYLESPDASLFLLNPNGVFFGENAVVDVGGSFYASTADAVNFEDTSVQFLTRESNEPVSFASTSPVSFGFLVDNPEPIEFATEELCHSPCVPIGETFSVVGGDILIDGLDDNSRTIDVPGGQIQLVSVARAGVEVPLDASALDVDADAYPAGSFGEVRLQNRAILTVPSDGSAGTTGTGKIVIRGGKFVLAGSDLEAVAGKDSIDGEPIGIDVAVTDSIELTSYEDNVSEVLSSSRGQENPSEVPPLPPPPRTGRSGDIHFSGDSFSMDGGSRILNGARDGAEGADVYIDAKTIELSGESPSGSRLTRIYARARDRAGTQAGNLYLSGKAPGTVDRAESVSIGDSAQLLVTSEDDAASGSISIATEFLEILLAIDPTEPPTTEEAGEVLSITEENGTSGLIRIDAGDALIADGGLVQSLTAGQNDGADIVFTGEKLTVTRGGEISTQVIDASATGNGGDIDITVVDDGIDTTVDEVEVTESGVIASINLGEGIGGAIDIKADDALTVSKEGQIFTRTGPVLSPNDAPPAPRVGDEFAIERAGGDLSITTGRLTVAGREDAADVTQISTITYAAGSTIPNVEGKEDGEGGDLTVHADQIDLIDGGQLRTVTHASAPAGALRVFAHGADGAPGTISIRGVVDRLVEEPGTGKPPEPKATPAGIFATSGERDSAGECPSSCPSQATGAGGKAHIEADIVDIQDGGEIQSSALGTGDGPAGLLELIGNERITVSGKPRVPGEPGKSSKIVAQGDVGDGGDLVITTGLLEIVDGGEASVSATTTGDSGDVTITADKIVVRGSNDETPSGIFAKSISGKSTGGKGGTIELTTGELVVTDDAQLAVTTNGGGDAGNIIVLAKNIEISNGGSVAAESWLNSAAAGDAGNIDLHAEQTVEVSSASVTTTARNAAGGRISIQAGHLVYLLDSLLETTVANPGPPLDPNNPPPPEDLGSAGDIDIPFQDDGGGDRPAPVVPEFVVINGSTIRANAVSTYAGNITITGGEVFVSSDSVISADSSTAELSGEILISSPDADVVSQVTPLPSSFVDPSDRLLPPCAARTERTGSFVVQSREAIPPPPDAPLSPALAGSPGAAGASPAMDSENCPVSEESS